METIDLGTITPMIISFIVGIVVKYGHTVLTKYKPALDAARKAIDEIDDGMVNSTVKDVQLSSIIARAQSV